MDLSQQLRQVHAAQTEGLRQLEEALRLAESANFPEENRLLRQQLGSLQGQLNHTQESLQAAVRDNTMLRETVYGTHGGVPAGQVEAMFSAEAQQYSGQLERYRQAVVGRIAAARQQIQGHTGPSAVAVHQKLNEAEAMLHQFLERAYQTHQRILWDTHTQTLTELQGMGPPMGPETLRHTAQPPAAAPPPVGYAPEGPSAFVPPPVTGMDKSPRIPPQGPMPGGAPMKGPSPAQQPPPQAPASGRAEPSAKNGGIEMKIGLRIASVAGIFFILLGVVFGLSYTYTYLLQSDWLKSLIAYVIGLLLLGVGEFTNRRKKNIVATVLCAGGVAVLFATTAMSYFVLPVLPAAGAVAACIVIAALAMFFAIRYESQIIAIFAVIGGHMPMLAMEGVPVILYGGMLYFLLLNLFVMLIAVKRRWQVLKFFSICLGTITTVIYLGDGYAPPVICTLYIAANFLLYLGAVLVNPFLTKSLLRVSDTVLLACNTVISCSFVYWVLNTNGLEDFNGLMALVFCVMYFVIAKLLEKFLEKDAGTRILFYATSLAFLALGVPMQFDARLITAGWTIEGVALCIFGIAFRRKWYLRAGSGLFLLGFLNFIFIDSIKNMLLADDLYVWRFGIIALGATAILATLKIVHPEREFWHPGKNGAARAFQFAALLFDWLFAIYLARYLLRRTELENLSFWLNLSDLAVTLGLAVFYRYLPVLRDNLVRGFSLVLYGLGAFLILVINAQHVHALFEESRHGLDLAQFMVLIGFNVLAILAMWDFLRALCARTSRREWHSFFTALLVLLYTVQILFIHPAVNFNSMQVSFVVLGSSLGLIVFGFLKRFTYTRWLGLGLSLCSAAKLFLIDLYFLKSWQRILSYFVFGVVLITISVVYQLFSKILLSDEQTAKQEMEGPPKPEA